MPLIPLIPSIPIEVRSETKLYKCQDVLCVCVCAMTVLLSWRLEIRTQQCLKRACGSVHQPAWHGLVRGRMGWRMSFNWAEPRVQGGHCCCHSKTRSAAAAESGGDARAAKYHHIPLKHIIGSLSAGFGWAHLAFKGTLHLYGVFSEFGQHLFKVHGHLEMSSVCYCSAPRRRCKWDTGAADASSPWTLSPLLPSVPV